MAALSNGTALRTEWDLSGLFASDADAMDMRNRRAVEVRVRNFAERWEHNADFLTDSAVLLEALQDYEALQRDCGSGDRFVLYWFLRSMQDQSNAVVRGTFNETQEWATKLGNLVHFFPIRVARLSDDMRANVLADERFAPYKHYLERTFAEAKHVLSESEEKVLALKSHSSSSAWAEMVERLLSKEMREIVQDDGSLQMMPFGSFSALLGRKNAAVRNSAARAMHDVLAKVADVAESEMNAILGDKKVNDDLRGFERPDGARHVADDIETGVVDALLAAVTKRNDIPARYYALKAKLLGMPKLAYHDRNVEYGTLPNAFDYADGLELVKTVLAKLDGEFADILERFVHAGALDVYPRAGKDGGAFCATQLLSTPTYILLNHTGSLRDVQTIAHEVGHGINNELMRKRQNGLHFGTPTSTAEVASTFMEDFVLEALRTEAADDETRLALMIAKLNDDVSSIFRQVACYRFEQELHATFRQKGYVSRVEIGELFGKHMAAYMGDAVEQSAGSENWWVYWSHIRRPFYVYSYASGLLISKSLQHSVREDKAFIGKVKEFLGAGMSASPRDTFLACGIDIADAAFWEKGIAEVEQLLGEAEGLAKKMGKI